MKIAVSDNGNEGKQKKYLEWLQRNAPDAELTIVGYKSGQVSLRDYVGVVMTGGEDIDPKLSQAAPTDLVQSGDRKRDDFEFQLLDQATKEKKPILGICRGLQVANVFLGGSLIADLPFAGFADHATQKNGIELRHPIIVEKESLMYSITGKESGNINSYHHQSVLKIADDLMVSGRSPDGVIESLEWKNKMNKAFLLLVQWHPERMIDFENPFAKNICTSFFSAVQQLKTIN